MISPNKNFFFAKKVGVVHNEPESYKEPISANIIMVQNGFELHYDGKEFIADTLDKALKMIKDWMTMDREDEGEEKSEHNSDHEE